MPAGIVLVVVDAEHDRDVRALRRRRDDDLLCPGRQVLGGIVAAGEEPGRLEDHVHAELFPRQLRGVAYSLLTFLVFVLISPYFLYQAVRYKKYLGSLGQRLGYLPISFNVDGEESIWIHAVSVGEALTARALAADLKARYPRLRLFLSTTTIAGQQVARRSLQHVDAVFYFPFDWAFIVRRTLDLVRPRVFIMMETRIWPNLLRECRARGVRTAVINGRSEERRVGKEGRGGSRP